MPDFEGWDPADHVLPMLVPLVVPIDSVHQMPKETNPQRGDTRSIAAGLAEFKQHIPIVVRESDGLILKGNNTWDAARNLLGWPGIAVVFTDDDDTQALGRMLSDNITSMNAHQDRDVFAAVMPDIVEYYPETFEALGYDPYEMAAIEETYARSEAAPESSYTPPVMVIPAPGYEEGVPAAETRLEAPLGIDETAAVVTGAPAVGSAGAKSISNYTLVFDSSEQQQRWYAFMRFVRSDPTLEADTFVEKFIEFLERHAEF